MKRTIRTLGWRFNADRMVMDYTQQCSVPAAGGTSSDWRPRGKKRVFRSVRVAITGMAKWRVRRRLTIARRFNAGKLESYDSVPEGG